MVTRSPASVSGAKKSSAVQGGAHTREWQTCLERCVACGSPVVAREVSQAGVRAPRVAYEARPGPASLGFCLGLPVRGSSRAWRTQRVGQEGDLQGEESTTAKKGCALGGRMLCGTAPLG